MDDRPDGEREREKGLMGGPQPPPPPPPLSGAGAEVLLAG